MLTWNDTFAVGVNKIDDQHKELFERVNGLIEAMKNADGKREVLKTLDFLEEYVVKHFNDEEALQRKYNYPKYNYHHEQHEIFKNEINELRNTIQSTGISVIFVINVQHKIVSWCKKHICEMDKELGEFLKKQQCL